jgi:hypothetical protein
MPLTTRAMMYPTTRMTRKARRLGRKPKNPLRACWTLLATLTAAMVNMSELLGLKGKGGSAGRQWPADPTER